MKPHQTMGLVTIHCAPAALRQHIEWGLRAIIDLPQELIWKQQPMATGTYRTTISYRAGKNTAQKIATALKNWHFLRFEVLESDDFGGELFRFTPDLGMHRALLDGAGSILISENVIEHLARNSFDEESLREGLKSALGNQWDVELEPFRGIELQEEIKLRAI